MADAPRSPVAFAPYRDSVDETAPLIPDDTEAGAASGGHAEPGAPGTQDGRASRRLDYRATIISSQVLFVASAIFLLFGGVAVTLILTLHGDSFKPSWRMEGIVQILSLTVFLCLFLSVANLVIFSRARARGETNPSLLAILVNVVAHAGFALVLVVSTINIIDDLGWNAPESFDKFVVLFFVWVACAFVLGWVIVPALLIFWLRGLIIWVSTRESWPSLSLPGGELTFQISLRFHRQEPLREAQGSV